MDYLRKIDMFGAPLIFNIDQKSKYHQTKFGGVSTFVIYSLVLVYGIMNFRTWASGELLPAITTQKSALFDQHIPLLSQLEIKISLVPYNSSAPLPTTDQQFFAVQYGIDNRFAQMDANNSYSFVLEFNPQNLTGTLFYILSCNPLKLTSGKCVNNATVAEYLKQHAYYFVMEFNLTYINPNTFEIAIVNQITYISVEQGYAHFSTINLGATLFQMQKPAIIQTSEHYYGFTTQKQYIETLQESYGVQSYYFSDPIYGSLYICSLFIVDFVSDKVLIQYPSIFTVLGNIGAIAGIILSFKYVILFYNSQEAEKYMIDTVVTNLFPTYQEIRIQKTLNVVRAVTLKDKQMEIAKLQELELLIKTKIYQYFSLPFLIINQIQFHHFMKEIHPNYQYRDDEFGSLIKQLGELDVQQEADNGIIDRINLVQIDPEPQNQSIN